MVDVYDEDFIEDDLNEIKDIKNEGMFDEEEALIEENENSPSSSSDGDSNNDKRFPVEEPIDWIHWFCKLKGNEYFVEVDENFIKKEENLEGIKTKNFLKIILSEKNTKDFDLTKELLEELQDIREIYGYIHKRFINTPEGLGLMREKFINGVFGYCPRMLCNKQVVLPVGLSEDMRYSQVKVFCPLCQEVYKPRDIFYGYSDKKIIKFDLPDGVFFGTSFPQTFLMHFPDLDPRINAPLRYIPKLYGFRIFGKYGSKYYSENKEELKKTLLKFKIINN
jgi:casein kinase II subunit beta